MVIARSKYDAVLFDSAVTNLSLPDHVIDDGEPKDQLTYVKLSDEPIYLKF